MPLRRNLDRRLKLHHLRGADAVFTQQSLLRASAALGVTQPALTKSLRELEDIVQLRLFERHPRGMRPTQAGIVFVQTARRILAELRRLDDELDRLSTSDGGVVAIGALPVTAAGVLPGALTRLKSTNPDILVRLQQGQTEELLPLLAAGEIDLIVGRLYEPAAPDRFRRQPLWEEPIAILARTGHPVFDAECVTIGTLRPYDLVLPTVSQRVSQDIDDLLDLLSLKPTSSLRSSSYGFIREMLHGTDLIAVMPALMMAGDLVRGTLKLVPLPVRGPPRPAGLILPPNKPLSAAGHAFVKALQGHLADVADITRGYMQGGRSDKTPADPSA